MDNAVLDSFIEVKALFAFSHNFMFRNAKSGSVDISITCILLSRLSGLEKLSSERAIKINKIT